jgi:hypothetical protein
MEGSSEVRSWLRCYRCWSQNLEVQVHYEGIHRIDADTGERGEVVDEMQEAVVQCVDCMHDQPMRRVLALKPERDTHAVELSHDLVIGDFDPEPA